MPTGPSDTSWATQRWGNGGAEKSKYTNAAIQDERYKLVHNNELYDLADDPSEKTNVADKHPDVVKRLRSVYDTFWADARPFRVNENASVERGVVRPYWELFEKHIGPIPPRRRNRASQ